MALEAQYLGQATKVLDYTPSSAVAAGQVLVLNGGCYVANTAIAANVAGSILADGLFKGTYADDGGTITDGAKVYWNDTDNEFTGASASATLFGRSVGGASNSSGTVTVRLISPGV
jgi:predicted RecA/RadA family phage recombinase